MVRRRWYGLVVAGALVIALVTTHSGRAAAGDETWTLSAAGATSTFQVAADGTFQLPVTGTGAVAGAFSGSTVSIHGAYDFAGLHYTVDASGSSNLPWPNSTHVDGTMTVLIFLNSTVTGGSKTDPFTMDLVGNGTTTSGSTTTSTVRVSSTTTTTRVPPSREAPRRSSGRYEVTFDPRAVGAPQRCPTYRHSEDRKGGTCMGFLRRSMLFALISFVIAASTASASTPGSSSTRDTPSAAPMIAATRALTCKVVPTRVIASTLGTSQTFTGTGYPRQTISIMGRTVLVGGKSVVGTWVTCGYAHDPKTMAGMGVSISYFPVATAAKAVADLKASCAAMRPVSSNYSAPAIGSGACLQGHTGGTQSSNGFVAVHNVLVNFFGSQSPLQTAALERDVARYLVVVAKWSVNTSPGAPTSNKQLVFVTTTQFVIGNGFMNLQLRCGSVRCVGTAELTGMSAGSPVVLAKATYIVPKGTTMAIRLSVTQEGTAFLDSTTQNPMPLTLVVTVDGGKTLSMPVEVENMTASPTTSVSTSTVVTTTTPG